MKVKSQIPLIVMFSWLSFYDFFSDRYIVAFKKKNPFSKYIMFENGFDITFSVLHFQKRGCRAKQGKTRISNFEECIQFSFRKNIKNVCSATSEPLMLKMFLPTSKISADWRMVTRGKCSNNAETRRKSIWKRTRLNVISELKEKISQSKNKIIGQNF